MKEAKETWHGEDADINWEVCKWKYGDRTCWNTYLYIIDKDMVKQLWTRKKKVYDWGTVYIPKQILEDLDWNGGQSFYHQIQDNDRKYIKVGDDYQHSWDEGQIYNEIFLIDKIRRTAKDLREKLTLPRAVN